MAQLLEDFYLTVDAFYIWRILYHGFVEYFDGRFLFGDNMCPQFDLTKCPSTQGFT